MLRVHTETLAYRLMIIGGMGWWIWAVDLGGEQGCEMRWRVLREQRDFT